MRRVPRSERIAPVSRHARRRHARVDRHRRALAGRARQRPGQSREASHPRLHLAHPRARREGGGGGGGGGGGDGTRGRRVRPRAGSHTADPARDDAGAVEPRVRGGRIFAVGIFTQPVVGGGRRGAAARPDPDPRDPAARRSPPSQVQARAHAHRRGRWHSRRGRRRAGRLGAPRAARVCDGPERSAPRVDPAAACQYDGAPEPGAGRVSRAETRDVDRGGGRGDATGDGEEAEGRERRRRRRGDRAGSRGRGARGRARGRG